MHWEESDYSCDNRFLPALNPSRRKSQPEQRAPIQRPRWTSHFYDHHYIRHLRLPMEFRDYISFQNHRRYIKNCQRMSSMPAMSFDANGTIGAYEIGVLISYVLLGITIMQAYLYFTRFPDDRVVLKCLVSFVWSVQFHT
ncbi:hypothetical protein R3P38DRAFT_598345 [Favolaschia claudopus]|uniref:Uncharacterized protein n=1 Tax=Favolaschia claudopus TaxID=2862362 RepID=A0AAV9Z7F6_9AGAR